MVNLEPGADYTNVEYRQYSASKGLSMARTVVGVLIWPLVVPMALVARISGLLFCAFSELLAIVPYFPGVILRYEFYRFTLKSIGTNVVIDFGTTLNYRDVEIGSHVLIGKFNVIHHCDFGDYVMTGERCTFLSGSRNHNTERLDVPMALQGGKMKRIRIDDDVWVGVHAVVADNVGRGSIVAMGTVVTTSVPEFTLAIGNPARLLPRSHEAPSTR